MALMVMMVAAYMVKPLDFAAFPTVLLVTTLLRLSLNVASTRVVLLEGHTGPGAAGAGDRGLRPLPDRRQLRRRPDRVRHPGGDQLRRRHQGRRAHRRGGRRFTLDAMPGKQMAIDADLNAGLIDEKEAKRRRPRWREEADFFGSMDGASKFVRGDAVAGILILFINIIGGFIIGVVQHGLSAGRPPQLHPAGRGRRAGGADPGAADLGGRGHGGVARGQGTGHRQPDRAADVHVAPRAGRGRGIVGLLG
jgi:flagellar biosynthesis protein FlhA